MQSDNEKKLKEIEKSKTDKADVDFKCTELQKELVLNKSLLNEYENTVVRQEKEIARINHELEVLKEQCGLKDLDLRSAINSLNEIQRQSVGEKSGLKAELT